MRTVFGGRESIMIKATLVTLSLTLVASPCLAQSYEAPTPTAVPTTGTKYLNKADRKTACTGTADSPRMKGLSRQQYRAACRGRPIPRG